MRQRLSIVMAILGGLLVVAGLVVAQSGAVITAENASQLAFLGGLANDHPLTYGILFDDSHLLVSTDRQILLVYLDDGTTQVVWETDANPALDLYLRDDVLFFQTYTAIHQLDLATGDETLLFETDADTEIRSMTVSESTIVMGLDDGSLQILGGETFAALTEADAVAMTFSPDASQLAVGYEDGTLVLWDMQGEGYQALEGHRIGRAIYDVDFNPDGTLLASAGRDGTIRLWDVASGEQRHQFDVRVRSLDFSPDGSLLAGGDKTLRIWDLATDTLLYEYFHSDSTITARNIRFSPDGSYLVSGSLRLALWAVDSLSVEAFDIMAVPDNRIEAGIRAFRRYGCGNCHLDYPSSAPFLVETAIDGSRISGMSTREYLYRSILYPDEYVVRHYPRGIHPGYYRDTMSAEDAWLLVEYIMSLEPED